MEKNEIAERPKKKRFRIHVYTNLKAFYNASIRYKKICKTFFEHCAYMDTTYPNGTLSGLLLVSTGMVIPRYPAGSTPLFHITSIYDDDREIFHLYTTRGKKLTFPIRSLLTNSCSLRS